MLTVFRAREGDADIVDYHDVAADGELDDLVALDQESFLESREVSRLNLNILTMFSDADNGWCNYHKCFSKSRRMFFDSFTHYFSF